MSDTPRTDAVTMSATSAFRIALSTQSAMSNAWVVEAWFARGLEQELAEANARIRRLEEAGDALCTTMQRESKYLFGSNFLVSIKIWKKAKEARP